MVKLSLAGLALLAATAGLTATPATAQGLDINKVFWCDGKIGEQTKDQCIAARDSILANCTSCHAITPIVKAQKPKEQWGAFLNTHRARVPDIAEDEYAEIGKFLGAHYTPENPVPKLPPELDKLGVPPA
jgi:hypothetical protein